MIYIYAIYKIVQIGGGELEHARYESGTYPTYAEALDSCEKIREGDKENVYVVHGAGYSQEYLTKQTTDSSCQKETKNESKKTRTTRAG